MCVLVVYYRELMILSSCSSWEDLCILSLLLFFLLMVLFAEG
jgi:hypothetical protein